MFFPTVLLSVVSFTWQLLPFDVLSVSLAMLKLYSYEQEGSLYCISTSWYYITCTDFGRDMVLLTIDLFDLASLPTSLWPKQIL
jgi:hypothetical protein